MTTLTELPRRLTAVWSKRGPRKFAIFVLGRFLRLQVDEVFGRDLRSPVEAAPAFEALRLSIVDARNPPDGLPDSLQKQLFSKEEAPLRAALYRDDALLFLSDASGRVAHASWIFFNSSYKRLLGLSDDVPLIGNCETIEAWRGRRLYPATLLSACAYLADVRRCSRVAISCSPANKPSVRGIERAGFVLEKRIYSLIVLNKLLLQKVRGGGWRLSLM